MEPIPANLTAIMLLIIVALAAAALLRRAGAPGSAMIGGALAGILLGPTIFGRIMPQTYEELLIGAAEQREQLQQAQRQHHAELRAAAEVGTDADAVDEMRQQHEAELTRYQRELDQARWSHQQPMRLFAAGVVGLTLLLGGMARIGPGGVPQSWGSAMSIGLWAAALPGALTFLAMRWWWEHEMAGSALVAAAIMIGPWMLTRIDRDAADAAELGGAWMIQTAGRVATVIALVIAGWALGTAQGIEQLLWAGVLLALPVGWLVGRVIPAAARTMAEGNAPETELPATSNGYSPAEARIDAALPPGRGYVIAQQILLPLLAACAAVRIEVIEHFAFWPVLVLLLLSGDGRWLGAVTGALLLGGRSGLRTMRLVLGSMACGPTQLAVLAIAVHLWALPDKLPLALLIGAIVIDATTPARRKIARQLAEAELELADQEDDS